MKTLIDVLTEELSDAFETCGYERSLGKVTLSNRPDLCEFQCNGAMAGAKLYKTAPIRIANAVAQKLKESRVFDEVLAVPPGFINLKVSENTLLRFASDMRKDPRMGYEEAATKECIVVDYGGANVAKPLHVGHLRPAIIGESVKRILKYAGHEVIGDVHLGDWGLPIGQIITELKHERPDMVYFDENYEGEYPEEAPVTIGELEEIYPRASKKSKADAEYREEARSATAMLQSGNRGYMALWKHIMNVSVEDLKKNYDNLDVHFELWGKESDAQAYIPGMIERLKEEGYAVTSEGALVVMVKREDDVKEIPPLMLLKSDGATGYDSTDLATIVERMEKFHPSRIIYYVDKRQELHFVQVFRAAKLTGIVPDETQLIFQGFGTMNGKDGKPYKTRDGGVMRLEHLISSINEAVYAKITEGRNVPAEEARETARIVGLAALKYGDLSNQAAKDYIFDLERFISFEGNTGPYILYSIVRIKSILAKYKEQGGKPEAECTLGGDLTESERDLLLELAKYNEVMETAASELAPHKICSYIYDVCNSFNRFYHETRILSEERPEKKESYIAELELTRRILEICIELLGFSAPDRM